MTTSLVLTLIPMVLLGLIAWGGLKSDVHGLRRDVDMKANNETVDAKFDAILRELQQLREYIERRVP